MENLNEHPQIAELIDTLEKMVLQKRNPRCSRL